ncbi:MAG TPA: lysophospholipid acyltransferase family protein [Candidatus Hydrogenedentes bacterium]|mgnify:CR=1 FL=1|jgi:1-acyl-sn-glycerol-3-phosphate acyltransferase|nr:lysophospholipid acyltransferase family protein [Candidatus Hydrogenedentota bacterium]HOD95547.1 lysophospholipid acyltransferase family protein [Candidatus Hydrogenedentota bacterium]HOR51162.1 lysophospholipid acyltransferase family protein [Candidatus Hydrogenedentota bacterium]HPK24882.1 lysophospholipid acyltransferase family protein [Candidatus Hydrogenedentota bacterium]HPX86476.1 lysophospholipid acyltransferase family protein [Candidatus Hydrogenedentota bacterium]
MSYTIFDTPFISVVGRLWARIFLGIIGWKKEGELPDAPKFVLIAAPHTTNWDLPIMLALGFLLRAKLFWMSKESIFRWPFGGFLRWVGGIAIDRSKPNGVVGQCIERFEQTDTLILAVPPEGTRKKVRTWKTGFYHIAVGANVPIALGYLDYKRRRGGVHSLFYPTGDYEKDLAEIQKFYAGITPKYPALYESLGEK